MGVSNGAFQTGRLKVAFSRWLSEIGRFKWRLEVGALNGVWKWALQRRSSKVLCMCFNLGVSRERFKVGVSKSAFQTWRFKVGVFMWALQSRRFQIGVSNWAFQSWRFKVGVSKWAFQSRRF